MRVHSKRPESWFLVLDSASKRTESWFLNPDSEKFLFRIVSVSNLVFWEDFITIDDKNRTQFGEFIIILHKLHWIANGEQGRHSVEIKKQDAKARMALRK